jgi:hypothetical protein
VAPRFEGLRFFLSIPLFDAPETMASVFVADFGKLAQRSGRLQPLGAVDVVLHARVPRSANEALHSGLAPRGLEVGPEASDDEPDESGAVAPHGGHKLGGRPFLTSGVAMSEEIRQALQVGFQHVLQVSFPDQRDGPISGNWPIGETELHLFAKPPFWPDLWRWCREY